MSKAETGSPPPAASLASEPAPARRIGRGAAGGLLAAAILLPLLIFAVVAWWSWEDAAADARERTVRITASLEEQARRLIAVQETLLGSALSRIRGLSWEEIAQPAVRAFLAEQNRLAQSSQAVAIVRLDTARFVTWSDPSPLPDIDLADRDYVRGHRQGGPESHVGEVIRSRPAGLLAFTLSRRDGEGRALAVALIELQPLIEYYAAIREGPADAVALVREDGAVLARLPAAGDPVGQRLSPGSVLLRFIGGELRLPGVARSQLDAMRRFYHVRRVGAHPLYVAYGLPVAAVRAAWLRDLAPVGLVTLLAAALLALMARRTLRAVEAQWQAETVAALDRARAAQADALAASEQRYRESEARLRSLADRLPNAAVYQILDDGGRWQYLYASTGIERLRGVSVEAVLADPLLLRRQVLPQYQAALAAADEAARKAMTVFEQEFEIERPDGERRWIRLTSAPRRIAGGHIIWDGIQSDVTERKQAEQRLQLLVHELNHRVKNTLATVQSIARQSLRGAATTEAAGEALTRRLLALSRAHDVLTRERWEGAELAALAEEAVAPYRDAAGRIAIAGPRLRLQPRAALALAMALHELATNAAKYGALSREGGRVALAWRVEPGAENPRLRLEWRESGGPPVVPPARRGFGSRLIEQGLARDLGGEAVLAFPPDGVVFTLDVPLPASGEG